MKNKVSIYQVFTRLFGSTKQPELLNGSLQDNGVGKMNDFTIKALDEIKKLGITHVWYTGIIAHARCAGNPDYNLPNGNPKIIKGRAGSPYAICDYYDVDADLAERVPNRMEEFHQLVERTHNQGMKVIIDFVPNHVAREYQSTIFPETSFGENDDKSVNFSAKNDFYYLPGEALQLPQNTGTALNSEQDIEYIEHPAKVTGNDQFISAISENDWYETVKLNYGIDYQNGRKAYFDPVPPVWDKMIHILEYWANKGIDGFRCDMVEMVPVDFWNYAISKIKNQYPDILFVAEVYNPALYQNYIEQGGFDLLYDKVGLYDTLKDIIQGHKNTLDISKCWQSLNGLSDKMLSFLENHDEQRIASRFFADDPIKALPAMLLSATINNGGIMLYFGQEIGEPAEGESGFSGDDGRTTIFDYYNVPEFQKWVNQKKYDGAQLSDIQIELRNKYIDILNFSISNAAFYEGQFYDLMWANSFQEAQNSSKLYAYIRFTKSSRILIVLNFDDSQSQQFVLNLPDDALKSIGIIDQEKVLVKGVFGDSKSYTIGLSEIKKRGIWMNIPVSSGKAFSIEDV